MFKIKFGIFALFSTLGTNYCEIFRTENFGSMVFFTGDVAITDVI